MPKGGTIGSIQYGSSWEGNNKRFDLETMLYLILAPSLARCGGHSIRAPLPGMTHSLHYKRNNSSVYRVTLNCVFCCYISFVFQRIRSSIIRIRHIFSSKNSGKVCGFGGKVTNFVMVWNWAIFKIKFYSFNCRPTLYIAHIVNNSELVSIKFSCYVLISAWLKLKTYLLSSSVNIDCRAFKLN